MTGKSVKRIITRRVLPIVLAAAVVAGVAEWRNLRLTKAVAATSLPGIENIRSSLLLADGGFNILEITQDGYSGEFGYYIKGQEPENFEETLLSKADRNERQTWATEYLQGLVDRNILSTEKDKTALYTADKDNLYTEYYPWENADESAKSLTLKNAETDTLKGTATKADNGDFRPASGAYDIVLKGQGDYSQNISADNPLDSPLFLFGTGDEGAKALKTNKNDYIFYQVDDTGWKSVNQAEAEDELDKNTDTANKLIYTDIDGHKAFDYSATVDREFQSGGKYYILEAYTGQPMFGKDIADEETPESLAEKGYLAARIDEETPFIEDKDGYFKENLTKMEYVGNGQGSYNISFTGDDDISVTYSAIKYTGGYTNNNWFLRYVFDYDENDTDIDNVSDKIKVTTVSDDKVPADLSAYGLVVISGGYKDGAAGKVNADVNIQTALKDYIGKKGAVLSDMSVTGAGQAYVGSLGLTAAQTNAGTYPNGFVKGSVFAFQHDNDRQSVQTSGLNKNYDNGQYENNGTAFHEVYEDVRNQNFLRRKDGLAGNIREDINMATAIRYIISYRNSAARKAKDKIRILEIEPGDESEITNNDGKTLQNRYLRSWFGNTYTRDKVEVKTMSSRTLDGKIDDISENYDLVYIGASSVLNDPVDTDMRGLAYYNIGDYVVFNDNQTSMISAGMMEEDFSNAPLLRQVYRSSGNDLTTKKKNELDSFVKSGHPVIVNDKLSATENQRNFNATITMTEDDKSKYVNGNLYVNTKANQVDGLFSYDYQWYRWVNDKAVAIEGATSSSYQVPESGRSSENGDMYFCVITAIHINDQNIELPENERLVSNAFWLGKKNGAYWCDVHPEAGKITSRSRYTFNVKGFAYPTANKHIVDHYTKLYSFLQKNMSSPNVWTSTDAGKNSQTVIQYLNISTPQIVFEKAAGTDQYARPAAYTDGMDAGDYLGNDLTMSFKVVNATDSSPETTTYTADILFDTNGDGLFSDDEKAQDVFVASDDDSANHVNSIKGGLNDDTAPGYSISVALPEDMIGAVNWKLLITQNSTDRYADNSDMPHASFNEVSYKQRNKADGSGIDKQEINILQVNSDGQWRDTYNLEMAQYDYMDSSGENGWSGNEPANNNAFTTYIDEYGKWLNNVAVKSRYNVNIVTIRVADFNRGTYPGRDQKLKKRINGHRIQGNIDLDDYDMLLFGFGDDYQALDQAACKRIKDYADKGKAVLFTHDNSNRKYIPSRRTGLNNDYYYNLYYNNNNNDPDKSYSSFAFDTILRYIDKMDVYGITDYSIGAGGRSEWGVDGIGNGFLTRKQQLTADQIQILENAGYSIAYKPDSNPRNLTDVTTVPETQGFSDYLLKRYTPLNRKADGNYGNDSNNHWATLTTRVDELNRGTITTYPYDLNGVEWNQDNNVTTTHGQYYQLNMNSDNIVVWFTVENAKGLNYYKKNDPANDYYLFSCGNIYYTGAGHASYPTENEAKLFINMMIAAYRQGNSRPTAQFVASSKSTKKVDSYLINTGDNIITPIDSLRQNIEEISGVDTSNISDADLSAKPVSEVMTECGLTEEDMNLAAVSATIDMAQKYYNEDGQDKHNSKLNAMNRANALKEGPAVIDGNLTNMNLNCTIDDVCKGIARVLTGKNNDADAEKYAKVNQGSYDDKHLYFMVRDNNNAPVKQINVKFYISNKKKVDDTYKTLDETGADKLFYKDVTDEVTAISDTESGKQTGNDIRSNTIFSMNIPKSAQKLLDDEGSCTLVMVPTTTLGNQQSGKAKTYEGNKISLKLQRVGLLEIG